MAGQVEAVESAMGSQIKMLEKLENKLDATEEKWAKSIKTIQGYVKIIEAVITPATQFEKICGEMNSRLGGNVDLVGDFRKELQQMDFVSIFDRDELALAALEFNLLGKSISEIMNLVKLSEQIAVGGFTGVQEAAQGLNHTLKAYSLESKHAKEISDGMFATMRVGGMGFLELVNGMAEIAPVAKTMGMSYQEALAVLAIANKEGLSPIAVKEMLAELKSFGLQGDTLAEKIQNLRNQANFSEEGMKGLFTAINSSNLIMILGSQEGEVFAKTLDQISDSTGALDQAVENASQNGWYKWVEALGAIGFFISNFSDGFLETFETIYNSVVTYLFPVLQQMGIDPNSAETWANFAHVLGGVFGWMVAGALAAQVLFGGFNLLLGGIKGVGQVFELLKGPFGFLIKGAGFLAKGLNFLLSGLFSLATANPILAIIIIALTLLYIYWDEICAFMAPAIQWICEVWTEWKDVIIGVFIGIISLASPLLGMFLLIMTYGEEISGVLAAIWDNPKKAFNDFINFVNEKFPFIKKILDTLGFVGNTISGNSQPIVIPGQKGVDNSANMGGVVQRLKGSVSEIGSDRGLGDSITASENERSSNNNSPGKFALLAGNLSDKFGTTVDQVTIGEVNPPPIDERPIVLTVLLDGQQISSSVERYLNFDGLKRGNPNAQWNHG